MTGERNRLSTANLNVSLRVEDEMEDFSLYRYLEKLCINGFDAVFLFFTLGLMWLMVRVYSPLPSIPMVCDEMQAKNVNAVGDWPIILDYVGWIIFEFIVTVLECYNDGKHRFWSWPRTKMTLAYFIGYFVVYLATATLHRLFGTAPTPRFIEAYPMHLWRFTCNETLNGFIAIDCLVNPGGGQWLRSVYTGPSIRTASAAYTMALLVGYLFIRLKGHKRISLMVFFAVLGCMYAASVGILICIRREATVFDTAAGFVTGIILSPFAIGFIYCYIRKSIIGSSSTFTTFPDVRLPLPRTNQGFLPSPSTSSTASTVPTTSTASSSRKS